MRPITAVYAPIREQGKYCSILKKYQVIPVFHPNAKIKKAGGISPEKRLLQQRHEVPQDRDRCLRLDDTGGKEDPACPQLKSDLHAFAGLDPCTGKDLNVRIHFSDRLHGSFDDVRVRLRNRDSAPDQLGRLDGDIGR